MNSDKSDYCYYNVGVVEKNSGQNTPKIPKTQGSFRTFGLKEVPNATPSKNFFLKLSVLQLRIFF